SCCMGAIPPARGIRGGGSTFHCQSYSDFGRPGPFRRMRMVTSHNGQPTRKPNERWSTIDKEQQFFLFDRAASELGPPGAEELQCRAVQGQEGEVVMPCRWSSIVSS